MATAFFTTALPMVSWFGLDECSILSPMLPFDQEGKKGSSQLQESIGHSATSSLHYHRGRDLTSTSLSWHVIRHDYHGSSVFGICCFCKRSFVEDELMLIRITDTLAVTQSPLTGYSCVAPHSGVRGAAKGSEPGFQKPDTNASPLEGY